MHHCMIHTLSESAEQQTCSVSDTQWKPLNNGDAGNQMQCINIYVEHEYFIVSVSPVGLQKLWILGDSFVNSTVNRYFLNTDSYAKTHMDVHILHGRRDNTENPISRLLNALITAFRSKAHLPKLIMIILEDDIIRYTGYNDYGVTALYGRLINFLSMEIVKIVDAYKKEIFPQKAVNQNWPQIVWVPPTMHANYHNSDNTLRKKFSNELDLQIDNQQYMHVIRFANWKFDDYPLVGRYDHRMSQIGVSHFWNEVDMLIKHVNTVFQDLTLKARSIRFMNNNDTRRLSGEEETIQAPTFRRHWRNWVPSASREEDTRNVHYQSRFRLPPPY